MTWPGTAGAGGFSRAPLIRLRMRLRRWLRWLVPLALGVSGFVVLAATQSGADADVENLWLPVALALMAAGATAWVWRAAEGGGFEALRWRRLHRRTVWRVAAASLLGGLAGLWMVAFWDWRADLALERLDMPVWDADNGRAGFFRAVSAWLSAAAPALVLVEPFVWRLYPRGLRQAVRRAKIAEGLAERRYGTRLTIDPALGAAGRPEPVLATQRGEPGPRPHAIRPHGRHPADWPRAAAAAWWNHGRLAWDGSALVVTDGAQGSWTFPVATTPADRPGEDKDDHSAAQRVEGMERVEEMVWYEEIALTRRVSSWQHEQVLLLDEAGRCIAEVPGAGFTALAVAGIAEAAGLPFAAYDLGTVRRDERPAHPLLFPRTGRTVKVEPLPKPL